MYSPEPIDTSKIPFPDFLQPLIERLAENVHENWAALRMSHGWTFGEVRDDARKQTPLLVPYSDLPESEKSYDRNTAIETVKLILSMGYTIR